MLQEIGVICQLRRCDANAIETTSIGRIRGNLGWPAVADTHTLRGDCHTLHD